MIEFDVDGVILDANANFLEAVGYSLEEIRGRHHGILFVDDATAESAEYAEFWRALNRGEFQAGQFERIDRSGAAVHLQATYTPILDTNGRPLEVVKLATNRLRAGGGRRGHAQDGRALRRRERRAGARRELRLRARRAACRAARGSA